MSRRLITSFDEEPVRRFVADAKFMHNLLGALLNQTDSNEVDVSFEELGAMTAGLFTVEVVEVAGGVRVCLVRHERDDDD